MPEEEEYEVLPHQLLEDLKYDVEELKKKLSQPDSKTQELILEIESLKDSLRDLQEVFHKALEIAKQEDMGASFTNLKQKVEAVVSQNETIAKALLTISDKLEEFMQGKRAAASSQGSLSGGMPLQHQSGFTGLPGQRMAPKPMMGPSPMMGSMGPSSGAGMQQFPSFPGSGSLSDLPPPPAPPSSMKRKGLF